MDEGVDTDRQTAAALLPLPDTMTLAEAMEAARQLYEDGELEQPLEWFLAIAAGAGEQQDHALSAQAATYACFAYRRLGELVEARRLCEQALDRTEAYGLTTQRVTTLNALGLVAWFQSRLPEAESLYRSSAELARSLGDARGVARAEGNMGLVMVEYGAFEEARLLFERFRDAGRSLGVPTYEANALTNLGMLAIWTGEPESAFEPLGEARRIYRAIDNAYEEVNAIGQLAAAWAALGRHDRARALIDSALVTARDQEMQQEVASSLEILAGMAHDSGDHAEALRLYDEARLLNDSAGYRLENGATLRSMAEIRFALGDTLSAVLRMNDALALHSELESPLELLRDYLVLAELAAVTGDFDTGLTHLAEARTLVTGLDARLPRAEMAIAEATVLDLAADAEGVLRVLDAAGADLAGIGYGLSWRADVLRARALERLGRLEQAVAAGRRAVRTIETQRLRIGNRQLRTSFLASRLEAYSGLVRTLLAVGRVGEAFEASDAAHGRSFLDHLTHAPSATRAAVGLPDQAGLARAVERVYATIDDINVLPSQDRDAATLDSLEFRLAALLSDGAATPAGGGLLGSYPISDASIRGSLVPGEVLIEYFVADSGSVAFVVTPDAVRALEIDATASWLATQGRIARDVLSRPLDAPALDDILQRLYAALIEPVMRVDGAARAGHWYVVPHGPLAYLPLDALRNPRTARFLVQDRIVQQLPSAATLPLLRARSGGIRAPVTASVFAPSPDELPGTAAEARTVASVVGEVHAAIGRDATEPHMRDHLGAGRSIVHFAGHGVLDPYNPLRSHLKLVGDDTASGDGRLELQEVLTLDVDSRLVFLSGCETGAGRAFSSAFSRTDDHATLAQAFLFAGADNVVATLWPVQDDGAAMFAARFYHHLSNSSVAEALALAKREMLTDRRFDSPFYWAGYQVSGADRAGAQTGAVVSVGYR